MDDLDQLSEVIEREALESLHRFCPDAARASLGLRLERFGDALVAVATEDPSILINRTLGLGTLGDAEAEHIASIAGVYADGGVGRFFLHVYEDELGDDVISALGDAGLERVRGWMKFRRRADEPIPEANTTLETRQVGPEAAMDFGRIVAGAFGMTPDGAPLLAGLADDTRWHLFVTYDGDSPAGAGALFVDDGVGWLEWGATSPDFRRRGSQAAVMAARLNRARELGCEHVFTETGEAVEGDPQHSYGNILKAGFRESKLRQNYAPRRS